jgi:hypothetical protein
LRSDVPLRQWRSAGLRSVGLPEATRARALRTVRWAGPYLVIWIPAGFYACSAVVRGECEGVCGLYHAFVTFSVLALATVLSTIVALVQLIALTVRGRQLRGMARADH